MRLIAAEVLKLRRRRGLTAFAALVTIAPMLIGYSVTIFLHATDAANHGPGGSIDNLSGSLDVLQTLSGVTALSPPLAIGALAACGTAISRAPVACSQKSIDRSARTGACPHVCIGRPSRSTATMRARARRATKEASR